VNCKTLVLVLVSALGSGCVSNWGSMNLATTRNVSVDAETIQRKVKGEDCLHMVLFIPLGKMNPNIEQAMNNALDTTPDANALINVSVYQETLFTYVYNRSCLQIEGDAVRVESGS
jgi:hypothetical protein